MEKHQLPETKIIYWRNSDLDFKSPDKLITSLELKPNKKNLLRTNDSLDESVLRHFLKKGANNIQQTQRTLESYRYKFGIPHK